MEEKIWSVSRVNSEVKALLEQSYVAVKGELLEIRSSGAWALAYFSLKDENAELPCVMAPEILESLGLKEGQMVVARGRLTLYERRGQFQLRVDSMEQAGVGTLQARIEEIKKKLEKEGLFADERKKALPKYPESIGVVTSSEAAALGDFVKVVQGRFPSVKLVLADVAVQGEKAAPQIAQALNNFSKLADKKRVDAVVVTRGGGSLEDLMAFNDEAVARAIASLSVPVVSAVGHERDVTIADMVADVRASTPSNAAEKVVPADSEVLTHVLHLKDRANNQLQALVSGQKETLQFLVSRPIFQDAKTFLRDYYQRLDEAKQAIAISQKRVQLLPEKIKNVLRRLSDVGGRLGNKYQDQLNSLRVKTDGLNPQAILSRGYSITTDASGKIVKTIDDVKVDQALDVRLHSGKLSVKVKKTTKDNPINP